MLQFVTEFVEPEGPRIMLQIVTYFAGRRATARRGVVRCFTKEKRKKKKQRKKEETKEKKDKMTKLNFETLCRIGCERR